VVRGFDFRRELGIFLFSTASRPALGPTQPPMKCVPGAHSVGVKRPAHEVDHLPPSSAEVKNPWSYTSTPIHLRRDNFNSQLYTLYTLNGRISNCNCGHSIGKDVEGRDLRLFCGNLLSQHLPTRTKERHKSQLR
jgi:hypothetical protein